MQGVWSLIVRDGSVAALTILLGRLASGHRFRGAVRRGAVSLIMGFARPMFAARGIEIAMARADRLVVGGWLGDRSLGLYDRSVFLAETGALALRPVSQLVFNLYARLQDAASQVCGERDIREGRSQSDVNRCFGKSLNRAIREVGSPTLTEVHDQGRQGVVRIATR